MNRVSIALAGNPNSGKTTLFNVLTGSSQHVGNWPGKTVEKRSGHLSWQGVEFEIVDLPGTYSLASVSPEESIARNYLFDQTPDVVVLVVDAANPERNLYLTVQVLEIGIPAVVALNMSDTAAARGLEINHELLQAKLGVPVVPMVARRRRGVEDLIDAVVEIAAKRAA